jgi:zinc transport system substrate-binding protein
MNRFLIIFFFVFGLVSCQREYNKIDILVTIYPFKFILDEIVKDQLTIGVLLPSAVDPHTYELIPSDMIKVQHSKLFIFGDKDLDGWAAKIEVKNKIQLSDFLPDSLKLYIPEKVSISSHHQQSGDDHNHYGFDPHYWTDPITLRGMIDNLANLLVEHFPEKKDLWIKNAEIFKNKLSDLDNSIRLNIANIKNKNIFSSHPFYNYFFKRYNFNIVGFLEISPGENLTPKEMKIMMDLIRKYNVEAIFTHRQHSDKTTKILAESLGMKYYDLDPIGGDGKLNSYDDIINYNLAIISSALK